MYVCHIITYKVLPLSDHGRRDNKLEKITLEIENMTLYVHLFRQQQQLCGREGLTNGPLNQTNDIF